MFQKHEVKFGKNMVKTKEASLHGSAMRVLYLQGVRKTQSFESTYDGPRKIDLIGTRESRLLHNAVKFEGNR